MVEIAGYEMLAELGRGRTAIVYAARDLQYKRDVAIKIPRPVPVAERAIQGKRFLREAQMLAALSASVAPLAVPKVYSVNEHNGRYYHVRELIEGTTLQQLACSGRMTLSEGFNLVAQVARTIEEIHVRWGMVHRNLHPANVLVTPQGKAILIGFSRAIAFDALITPQLTVKPDVLSLRAMLGWLCLALGCSIPADLRWLREPQSVASAAELATVLRPYTVD
jgi:serine/threonine-protein kinase